MVWFIVLSTASLKEAEGVNKSVGDWTPTDLAALNSRKEREANATVGVLNPCPIRSRQETDSAAVASQTLLRR